MRFGKDVFLVALLSFTSLVMAADVTIPLDANTSTVDLSDANAVSFPYTAEITGTDIYMRSGPGMNYYRCGKLSVPDKIEVVAHQNGWSKIVPPAGSFSWISKEYVKIDSNDAGTGIVTSDDVRVWAGSEYVEPMHSTSLQAKLSKGAKVYLFGEEKGDYYKIAPPKDAYLWVNTQYTRFAGKGPMESMKMPADSNESKAHKMADANAPKTAEANEPNAVKPAPKKINIEAEKLKEYRQLTKDIDAEKAKPIQDQNWTSIKTALTAIAENEKAGKAAKYSKAQLDRIESFELAAQAGQALQQQQQQLNQARKQIEKKRQEELAKIPNVGRFAIQGTLRASALYAADAKNRRYAVVDDSGKIVAYAVADEAAASIDVSKFLNHKVGLVGRIERDQQSGSSLVHFTEIVDLNQ